MAREYYVLEENTPKEAARPLLSVAIHPSGYYMAASFIDKIRLHHILHDEFKHYQNIDIRYVKQMKFSKGGHLFACVENNLIHIFNSYTIEKIHSIKMFCALDSEITQLIFNDRD